MDQRAMFDFIKNLDKIGVTAITVRNKEFIRNHFDKVDEINPQFKGYSDRFMVAGIEIIQDRNFIKTT